MKTICTLILVIVCTLQLTAQWTQMTAPNGSGINYNCLFSNDSVFLAGSNGLGIHKSTDNGLTWTKIPNATIEASTNIIIAIGKNIYIGTSNTGVHVTPDNGTTWTTLATGMVNKKIQFINAMGRYIFAAGPTFYRSVDSGANWTAAGTGLPGTDIKGMIILNDKILISAKDNGLYSSTDSGATFSAYNANLPHKITGSVIQKGTKLFLLLGSTVVVSADSAGSWAEVGTGLPSSIANVFLLYTDGTNIFMGTFASGCYYTASEGASWSDANTGLTVLNVRGFAVRGNDVFCSADNGIWKRSLSSLTAVQGNSTKQLKKFSLSQNYPNPFNPTTIISYELPNTGYVSLKVYDILGNEIATVANGFQEAGEQHVQFNATQFSSGTYFYTLRAGSFVETKKMLLVK